MAHTPLALGRRRLFFAAALLGALSVTAAAEFHWEGPTIKKDEVVPRAKKEFDEVRQSIRTEYNGDKHLFGLVDRAQGFFESHAKERLKDAEYHDKEIEMLSHIVHHVLIKDLRDQMDIASARTEDERARLTAQAHENHEARMAKVQEYGQRHGFDDMVRNSEIIRLGVDSAKFAAGVGNNPPSGPTGGPGGGGSTGGVTPNSGQSPTQDMNQAALSGASAGLAARSGAALDNGRYAEAVADAQNALKLDPANAEANTVLHMAAGHVEGGAASGPAGGATPVSGGAGERGFAGGRAAAGGHATFGGFVGAGGGAAGGSDGGASRGSALNSLVPSAAQRGAAARLSAEQSQRAAQNAIALHDLTGAMAFIERGLALDPKNPALLHQRGSVYARQHDYAKAIADEKTAFELMPKDAEVLRELGKDQLRGGLYKDALATANAYIEAHPNEAFGYALRAQAYARLGDHEAYLADLRRAAELDPYYREVSAHPSNVQNPTDADLLFLFPGEDGPKKAAAPAPDRGRQFSWVVAASILGGLLMAFGLLQTVLAPLKEQVSSVFTRLTRTGPTVGALDGEALAAAAPTGLIRGQYEITRPIGAGGMGMVFEGTDRSLGRRVAIKKMRDELRADPRERARFIAEAKTVATMHHPNIVDIFAIADDGSDVYLIFEFVDGKTVHDLTQASGKLAPEVAARIVASSAEALEYAHARGVIHRDMKPSNVMVDASGRVKVMDFGIARMAKDALTRYTNTMTVVGTPPYMAPEQEQGQVRRESDVYALAVCAYEMLTGRLPFAGIGGGMLLNKINMSYTPPSRETAGLPAALDDVFARAFQPDPDMRYPTPKEFADALGAAVALARRA